MKTFLVTIAVAALLAACGTTTGDRGLSGAGIGAGIGILGGPVGVVIGGATGAVVGAVTSPEQIDLGPPIWRG